MTNEEAIKAIKANYPSGGYERLREALDMAIKALEQESKSEWEHDHEILKAYYDGASDILDKIRAEINSKNRDTCDYFIVDRIEEIINKYEEGEEEE